MFFDNACRSSSHKCGVALCIVFWGLGLANAWCAPLAGTETYNYILGTQAIGCKYQFSDDPMLVETAKAILEMGSNILKFSLAKQHREGSTPPYSLTADAKNSEPTQAVLDMPFTYYFIWAYGRTSGKWADGFTDEEQQREYDEVYEFTQYLLKRLNNTGKTVFLGHWEGDWHLHPGYDPKRTPSEIALKGMVQWLNTRQRAVDDARRDTPHAGVNVYHYTEVNLVQKGILGESCLTNDVLPYTNVDYVSYSCYDSINMRGGPRPEDLRAALDHIESKLQPKPGITGKRVFIGEYGFPLERTKTPEEQDRLARIVARTGVAWGCPFVLYWQIYCNEIKNGKHRGFWLIDNHGIKQPFYHTLHDCYEALKLFITEYTKQHGEGPSNVVLRKFALDHLNENGK